jgi:hypothetical protein
LKVSDDDRSIGKVVLTSQKVFANFKVEMINKLIKSQNIDYVLDNLSTITFKGRDDVPD